MTQETQGVPPPEMEPQIGGGMYAAAIAAAPATTWGPRIGALHHLPIHPGLPGIATPMDPNMQMWQ